MRFALLLWLVAQDDWKNERLDIKIPMRDGKGLAADVYLPPKPGQYPTVLIQTPYGKKSMGAPISGAVKSSGEAGRGAVSDMLTMMDRENYAYVVVDWRGFYGSKAAMEGVHRAQWRRGQDGFDCVEWIAKQSWSNGKVGTWGGSALGKQQFDTAVEKPPHLVCAVPLIASMGQSYDSYYEGGVLLESHVKTLDLLGYGVSTVVRANPKPDAAAWTLAERATYHPELVEIPCLVITGWWDHFPDQVIRTFENLGSKKHSKMLIGPWDHVSVGVEEQGELKFPGAARESAAAAKKFFDFWLRGVQNGWDKTARVRYWTIHDERWTECESWSGMDRKPIVWNFEGGDYVCDPKDPTPTSGGANLPPLKHGPWSQESLSKRKDVLVFSKEASVRINGKVELSFDYEIDRECCDFTARLCSGPYLISDIASRVRSKTGRVTLRFPATALAAKEIRVYVSSSNWPRYERNAHTGADHWDEKTAVPVKVSVKQVELKLPTLE
jgi:hypothetical protein